MRLNRYHNKLRCRPSRKLKQLRLRRNLLASGIKSPNAVKRVLKRRKLPSPKNRSRRSPRQFNRPKPSQQIVNGPRKLRRGRRNESTNVIN